MRALRVLDIGARYGIHPSWKNFSGEVYYDLIEADSIEVKRLKKKYKNYKNIKIYNDDILKINVEKIMKEDAVVFGNLPYNISSQILVKFLRFKEWPPKFNNLIFMFQKELGEKIIGKFQTKNYSRISILSNLKLSVFNKFYISSFCFRPKPKVSSVLLHFKPKEINFKIKNISNLEKVTQVLFSNKRKMINKTVKKLLKQKQLEKIKKFKLESRPSELRPEIYYKITELIEKG